LAVENALVAVEGEGPDALLGQRRKREKQQEDDRDGPGATAARSEKRLAFLQMPPAAGTAAGCAA
jgi:hypothetical protein